MSGRKVAFGVYRRYILVMSATNLTTNQKIDALYEMVTGLTQAQSSMQKDISSLKDSQSSMQKDISSLKGSQSSMQKDISSLKGSQSSMQKDISEMKSDIKIIKKEVHSLVTVVPDALMMAAKSTDRLDDIVEKKKNSPARDASPNDVGRFTPFTGGAFVA